MRLTALLLGLTKSPVPMTLSKRGCWVAAAGILLSGCTKEEAPSVARPPQVVVATVEPQNVSIFGEWIGRLDGSANVDIRARVQGYVQEIAFNEGTVVKEGDLLVRIDSRPYEAALAQAKAELAQAIASQQKAEQEEQRQTQLFNKKIASEQDYNNAVQVNLAAKATVEAARAAVDQAQLNLDFATITSPITGIVGRTDFSIGNFVAAGSSGAEITKSRRLTQSNSDSASVRKITSPPRMKSLHFLPNPSSSGTKISN